MFAKYVFRAGATSANVVADLCKLIAGGALADLSADCVQASCTLAGASPGWTTPDSANGIISAPFEDGTANKIYQISYLAGLLRGAAAETWNPATHAGTNLTTAQGTVLATLTAIGTLYISACPENVVIYDAGGNWLLFAELSRASQFTKNRAGSFVARNGVATFNICRVKVWNAVGDALNAAANFFSTVCPYTYATRGDGEVLSYQTWPLNAVIGAQYTNQYLLVGPVRGVVQVPAVAGCGDTMTDDAGGVMVVLPGGIAGTYFTMAAVRK